MSGISITIIGGGKMGEAILKGWLASTYVPAARIEPADVVVVEPGEERRAFLSAEHGVTCVADASLIEPGQTDVVVLSVKPQVMMNVLETVSANPAFSGGADGPLFISIAAGIPTTRLEAALPKDAHVVRVMPNMPLSIGAGASGVCKGAQATNDEYDYVVGLFGCLGRGFDLRFIRDIAFAGGGLHVEVPDDLLRRHRGFLTVEISNEHICAGLGQKPGRTAAHAAGAADDDRVFAGKRDGNCHNARILSSFRCCYYNRMRQEPQEGKKNLFKYRIFLYNRCR